MSILPHSLPPRSSFQDDNKGSGSGSWRQLIGQARIDEAKAEAAAASVQVDHAVLKREKWLYEKQEVTARVVQSLLRFYVACRVLQG
jgi:hypothetical protein